MEIRALLPSDDRCGFQSGDEALDHFFRRYAGQNQFRHYLGVTYVAVDDRHVLGFVTIAPGQIDIDLLPSSVRKKMPRYPLPILRIARLAVGHAVRSRGLGAELLRFACRLGSQMADSYGCAGMVVDAKADAVAFYAKYGFISHDALEGQSEARPPQKIMFLSMRAIKAASETPH